MGLDRMSYGWFETQTMALAFQYYLRKSKAIYLYMFHIGYVYEYMQYFIMNISLLTYRSMQTDSWVPYNVSLYCRKNLTILADANGVIFFPDF